MGRWLFSNNAVLSRSGKNDIPAHILIIFDKLTETKSKINLNILAAISILPPTVNFSPKVIYLISLGATGGKKNISVKL